ncbi:MAG TPA: hypothetical protein DCQ00_08925 [Phascolarctobacterium succinatutens]|nr:hypothetical protein [Phascolarctobacterium succinatutens]
MHELPAFFLAGISDTGSTYIMDDGLQVLQPQLDKFGRVDSLTMAISCIVIGSCALGYFMVMLGRP